MRLRAAPLVLGALIALALAAPAQAISPTITEFSSGLGNGDRPLDIASGPDRNLWFPDSSPGGALGRITTAGVITKFTAGLGPGSRPFNIAAGPDGDLWFTDDEPTNPAIGRIDTTGKITEFPLSAGSSPAGITAGSDGNLWFTDRGTNPAIGSITPAGAIREFNTGLHAGAAPAGIAAGGDGNLWFADGGSTPAIGRITMAGAIQEFTGGLNPGSAPADVAAGPDGNLWFTDEGATRAIGRATTAGEITEFTAGLSGGSDPLGITAGADGALWFADRGTVPAIGRVLPSGSITEFHTGLNAGSVPSGIGSGPDGNVWFTDVGATKAIGRITTPPAVTTVSASPTGATTAAILGLVDGHAQPTSFHVEYGLPGGTLSSTGGRSLGTTSGPTHVSAALSGLRPNTRYQARIVAANGTDSAAGELVTFTTSPPADRITRMTLRPKVFVAASRGGPVRPARAPGALVSYMGTQPATTTFTVERAILGRRSGRNCVKPNRRNRSHATCTLYVKVGSFKHKDAPGRNRFRLTGRLHHRTLSPGNYRLDAEPHSAGGIGRVVRKSFGVKAAPRRHHRR